jgi:2-polyprenyl-3-methyl-5-hydroxy-6-metoxy-1,4-benzoquinol methylase
MSLTTSNGDSLESETAIQVGNTLCIVCGGTYAPSRRLPGLVQCNECGFLSADLRIPDEELPVLYGEAYFKGEEYLDYMAEEPSLRRNFRNRLATLKTIAPHLACCDLLEIGCAYGFFLEEATQWVRSASGIDISTEPIRFAAQERGVEASQGDYLSLELGRKFDVIAMWDTIEHLNYPHIFIDKIARDLKPGGLLALTTGDIGSLVARLQGRHWRLIHPPTHLHYFSAATISEILRQKGFEVLHLSHPGNSRSLRAALYFITVLQMKRKGLYDALQGSRIFNWHLTVNLFDIMYVIARRQS